MRTFSDNLENRTLFATDSLTTNSGGNSGGNSGLDQGPPESPEDEDEGEAGEAADGR